MPTQAQLLRSVARKGRGGDTDLAHVSKGDVVIPVEAQSKPEISAALKMLFQRAGLNQKKFTVGTGKRNYKTGLQAFDAESAGGDPSGGGGSSGGGSDASGTGAGADPGGGTSGTAAGEHGAEKGAATGTDPSGIGGPSTGGTDVSGGLLGLSSQDVAPSPSLGQPASLSAEDLLSFDASKAPATDIATSRTGEQIGPGLGDVAASVLGYNLDPTLSSSSIAGLFGPAVAPGFNTNVVDNALSVAGLLGGPLGLASTANTLGKDIFGVSLGSATQGLTGLATPEASLGDLFGGKSIPGDPTTGDLVGATSTGVAGSQAGLRSGTGLEGEISGSMSPSGGFPGISGPSGSSTSGAPSGSAGGASFLDSIAQVLGMPQTGGNFERGGPSTASRAPVLSTSPVISRGSSPVLGGITGPSMANLIYQARALGELA